MGIDHKIKLSKNFEKKEKNFKTLFCCAQHVCPSHDPRVCILTALRELFQKNRA